MLTLLSYIFIKNREDYENSEVRKMYGMLSGALGIFLNLFLFVFKLIAGIASHAVSIIADAFNNLSDAASSIVILLGFRMAGYKPDKEHPYGHGRVEYLSGVIVSLLIVVMAVEIIQTSFEKNSSSLSVTSLSIAALLVSIAVKIYMFIYNLIWSKRIKSLSMRAAALDSISDVVSTAAVLAALLISQKTGLNLDRIMGILVGLLILYTGLSSLKDTVDPLIGREPDAGFVEKIKDIALSFDDVKGVHDVVVHDYGPGKVMISLHIEVPADQTVYRAHVTADECEKELEKELGCMAVIHMDPYDAGSIRTREIKLFIRDFLKDIDGDITIHDFQEGSNGDMKSISFDILIPFESNADDHITTERLLTKLKERYPEYEYSVRIDKF
ncbi:MAG: cation diffusion facilitator family transporter [Lachnospiraceae bacterium]|jgi:cation diffusion facilitator family transporter|nr:cation diffusion facilitator family transporter [Lachnospiraceae bacterium]MEE3461899.1 cation diffusion facilitator family transporter [Lachnospiraceae bacterium]